MHDSTVMELLLVEAEVKVRLPTLSVPQPTYCHLSDEVTSLKYCW
jgi:hypothetical protein